MSLLIYILRSGYIILLLIEENMVKPIMLNSPRIQVKRSCWTFVVYCKLQNECVCYVRQRYLISYSISKLHEGQQKFDLKVEVMSPTAIISCHLKSEDFGTLESLKLHRKQKIYLLLLFFPLY